MTPVKSFQHITDPEGLGRMLYRVDFIKSVVTPSAAQVVYYCFPRIEELLESHWSDIDFERGLWTLPAAHTKMRRDHIIPFPSQVRNILLNLREYETEFLNKNTERGFVFPARNPRKEVATHITEAGVLKALKNIVVAAAAEGVLIPPTSVHGFRHTASTILHGLGENTLVIEKQMTHLDSNRIRAVYNSYEFLNERREMLQRYANYLDSLKKSGGNK